MQHCRNTGYWEYQLWLQLISLLSNLPFQHPVSQLQAHQSLASPPPIPGLALTANCLVFFQLRTAYTRKEINNLTNVPFVFLFDRSGSKNQNQNSSREKVCLCMCIDACARVSVCVCACAHVCMCVPDEEGSRVFASRALGVVQTAMCLTGYNCLTGFLEPLLPPHRCHTSSENV